MCGRLNVVADPLVEVFDELTGKPYPGEDNRNTAPTEQVWIVRQARDESRRATSARWWLTPYWSKTLSTRYAMFNARAEGLSTSNAFGEPFRRRRCVVPVCGFYEWTRVGRARMPYYIRPAGERPMLLAGVWDRWRDPSSGAGMVGFAVVTTAATPGLAFVHDRQPRMLSFDEACAWMDGRTPQANLADMLAPALPQALDVIPVSTHVNNARNKEPLCTEPIGEAIAVEAD
ncbi:MAG: SOS response-associated peptidase [Gammaproteobacteria bacterium]|nr:SOS response-associated peptidase [Gammaproteobacteria bacterium]